MLLIKSKHDIPDIPRLVHHVLDPEDNKEDHVYDLQYKLRT